MLWEVDQCPKSEAYGKVYKLQVEKEPSRLRPIDIWHWVEENYTEEDRVGNSWWILDGTHNEKLTKCIWWTDWELGSQAGLDCGHIDYKCTMGKDLWEVWEDQEKKKEPSLPSPLRYTANVKILDKRWYITFVMARKAHGLQVIARMEKEEMIVWDSNASATIEENMGTRR